MALFPHFSLIINKNEGVVISIKDSFLTQDVVPPLLQGLNQTIELLIVGTIVQLGISKSL